MNPFELSGPDFLGFYTAAVACGVVVAVVLRWWLRRPGGEPEMETLDLSPYEVAYLAGGGRAPDRAATSRCSCSSRPPWPRAARPEGPSAVAGGTRPCADRGATTRPCNSPQAGASPTCRTQTCS